MSVLSEHLQTPQAAQTCAVHTHKSKTFSTERVCVCVGGSVTVHPLCLTAARRSAWPDAVPLQFRVVTSYRGLIQYGTWPRLLLFPQLTICRQDKSKNMFSSEERLHLLCSSCCNWGWCVQTNHFRSHHGCFLMAVKLPAGLWLVPTQLTVTAHRVVQVQRPYKVNKVGLTEKCKE